MTKYKCVLCGWIYDPAVGDPDNGVDPGTSFEDIPDDWICPDCGAQLKKRAKICPYCEYNFGEKTTGQTLY